jgi:hypothetical protein
MTTNAKKLPEQLDHQNSRDISISFTGKRELMTLCDDYNPLEVSDSEEDAKEKNLNKAKIKRRYIKVKEIRAGSYFGDIGILTNYPTTSSIHVVGNTICGSIKR